MKGGVRNAEHPGFTKSFAPRRPQGFLQRTAMRKRARRKTESKHVKTVKRMRDLRVLCVGRGAKPGSTEPR